MAVLYLISTLTEKYQSWVSKIFATSENSIQTENICTKTIF